MNAAAYVTVVALALATLVALLWSRGIGREQYEEELVAFAARRLREQAEAGDCPHPVRDDQGWRVLSRLPFQPQVPWGAIRSGGPILKGRQMANRELTIEINLPPL